MATKIDGRVERQPAGVGSMALAAFFFSVMSLFVKLVGTNLPSQEIVMVRSAMTLIFTLAALWKAGVSPWGNNRGLLLFRGVTGFAALSCFFFSIVHLPLAEATVIQFTYPVFTALLASLFLREALNRRVMIGIGASLVGVSLIARPAFLFGEWTSDISPWVALVAVTGALLTAAAYVSVRRLARSDHTLVAIFYFPLISLPAAAVTAVPHWIWPSSRDWLLLLAASCATQLAQVFLTRGLFREEAGRAASIAYLQVAFAALWGVVVFAEVPDWGTVTGGVLILASCLQVARLRGARAAVLG